MKFKIKKTDIQEVLGKVQGLAGRKTNLAITTNVLIRAQGSEISIIATDLETGFEGTYPAEVESEGAIALNAKKIFEIIKEFPSESVSFNEVENQWIEIGNGKVEYHLMGMNPEEFPDNPSVEDAELVEVESDMLAGVIEKTLIVSGAGDDRRAHITGILYETREIDGQIMARMVSTDGSRLSKADCQLIGAVKAETSAGVIVPKKGLNEIQKFLESTGTVRIGFKGSNFIVKKEAETIIVRLLEGEFPQYESIILKSDERHQVHLDKTAFLKMLRRMSILASDNYKGVVFKFDKDFLELSVSNPEIGEAKEDIGIEFDGQPFEVAFNPRFFIETLNVIDGDRVTLNLIDAESPCLVEDNQDSSYLSVIMPMRI
ncbi:MAG: DNA polymerase III subunit beta [Desulfobacterales bacterium]